MKQKLIMSAWTSEDSTEAIEGRVSWDTLSERLCNLMAKLSYPKGNNITITFRGYTKCASVLNKGLPEEKAPFVLHISTGQDKLEATAKECEEVISIYNKLYNLFISVLIMMLLLYSFADTLLTWLAKLLHQLLP